MQIESSWYRREENAGSLHWYSGALLTCVPELCSLNSKVIFKCDLNPFKRIIQYLNTGATDPVDGVLNFVVLLSVSK